ncbi:cation:proton antiporter [Spirochaeta cellobiosiphila]|uniref:cation:proton antiporter domain-containing protein n=1 Tax=Spirochaeta cellobiosiphila TaxID=504483 RepID=UPI000414F00B|nr:cation:proton antiporter [Spirochaeta cellobiosiphila]
MKRLLVLLIVLLIPSSVFAEGQGVTQLMTELVVQLGIILFAARLGGRFFKKIGLPGVLGEMIAGILIGPFLLGSIPIPGFPHGIFALHQGDIPVTVELYGFSTIASVILLFLAGLETDINMFLRYSLKGSLIGIGGLTIPFILGDLTAVWLMNVDFMDPPALFLGVISMATSVGISARILSEKKKMDSPEGVTILAAAVIDDVLGIIFLAIVVGIAESITKGHGGLSWSHIGIITAKAFGVWLGFSALGLLFSKRISKFLKSFNSIPAFSVLSLGMALVLAGVFEHAGLAMIIGAYVMGLSLSKTDISYVIQENLFGLHEFFVPIFFTVMGMLVNVKSLMAPQVLIVGLVYSAGSVLGKVIGCGLPSLGLGFNKKGALRIGFGMIPRGEVSLIIAGIGLSSGYLSPDLFGIAVIMTLISVLVAPSLFEKALAIPGIGTHKEAKGTDTVITEYDLPSPEVGEFLVTKLISSLEHEGFFIHMMELGTRVYQLRKDDIFCTLEVDKNQLRFITAREDLAFIKTLIYESLIDMNNIMKEVKNLAKPDEMRKELATEAHNRGDFHIHDYLDQEDVELDLKSNTKDDIIGELVNILYNSGKIPESEEAIAAVFEREASMSTGMQNGVAIPHGRSSGIDTVKVAIGVKKGGIPFDSIDGKPSNIFLLLISPKDAPGPHLKVLSSISAALNKEEVRQGILTAQSRSDLLSIIDQGIKDKK